MAEKMRRFDLSDDIPEQTQKLVVPAWEDRMFDQGVRAEWLRKPENRLVAAKQLILSKLQSWDDYNPYGVREQLTPLWKSLVWTSERDMYESLISRPLEDQKRALEREKEESETEEEEVMQVQDHTSQLLLPSKTDLPQGKYVIVPLGQDVLSKVPIPVSDQVTGVYQLYGGAIVKWHCSAHAAKPSLANGKLKIPCAGRVCGTQMKKPRVMYYLEGEKLVGFTFRVNRDLKRSKSERYQQVVDLRAVSSDGLYLRGEGAPRKESTGELSSVQETSSPPTLTSPELMEEGRRLLKILSTMPWVFREDTGNPKYAIFPVRNCSLIQVGVVQKSYLSEQGLKLKGDKVLSSPLKALYFEDGNLYWYKEGEDDTKVVPYEYNPQKTAWEYEQISKWLGQNLVVLNMGEDSAMLSLFMQKGRSLKQWKSWEEFPVGVDAMIALHSFHHAGTHAVEVVNRKGPNILVVQEHGSELTYEEFIALH